MRRLALHQVPQLPIRFGDLLLTDGDDIIAYTFRRFLNSTGNNPSEVVLFPMTKAAKRGLDTIQSFALTLGKPVVDFTVGGMLFSMTLFYHRE